LPRIDDAIRYTRQLTHGRAYGQRRGAAIRPQSGRIQSRVPGPPQDRIGALDSALIAPRDGRPGWAGGGSSGRGRDGRLGRVARRRPVRCPRGRPV